MIAVVRLIVYGWQTVRRWNPAWTLEFWWIFLNSLICREFYRFCILLVSARYIMFWSLGFSKYHKKYIGFAFSSVFIYFLSLDRKPRHSLIFKCRKFNVAGLISFLMWRLTAKNKVNLPFLIKTNCHLGAAFANIIFRFNTHTNFR